MKGFLQNAASHVNDIGLSSNGRYGAAPAECGIEQIDGSTRHGRGAMFSPSNQETGNAASDEQHLKVNAILLRDP
jgi:hypothetical protein